jgi:hypothetical protein
MLKLEHTVLSSSDVKDLVNIPTKESVAIIRLLMKENCTDRVILFLDTILKKNHFKHQDKCYKPMGSLMPWLITGNGICQK